MALCFAIIFISIDYVDVWFVFSMYIGATLILCLVAVKYGGTEKPTEITPEITESRKGVLIFSEEEKQELENFLFRNITINANSFKKLEVIAEQIKKTPQSTVESIINEMHYTLKKRGKI